MRFSQFFSPTGSQLLGPEQPINNYPNLPHSIDNLLFSRTQTILQVSMKFFSERSFCHNMREIVTLWEQDTDVRLPLLALFTNSLIQGTDVASQLITFQRYRKIENTFHSQVHTHQLNPHGGYSDLFLSKAPPRFKIHITGYPTLPT